MRRDPVVAAWLQEQTGELRATARHWFEVMRGRGDDVRELMHDGHATACARDAAFAYVGVFTAHVSVGFFRGTDLPDPSALLEGSGKLMRHVKLEPGREIDGAALFELIEAAYLDMKARLETR